MQPKKGYGNKDGSQVGAKAGGGRRNQTTPCRHPLTGNRPTK